MSEGYYSVSSSETSPSEEMATSELFMTDEQIEMLGTGQLGDILESGDAADEMSDDEDLEADLARASQEMRDIGGKISHLISKLETMDNILTVSKIAAPWGTFQRSIWQAAGLPDTAEEIEVVLSALQKWVWKQGFDIDADGSWMMDWEGGRRRMTWIEFVVAMLE
jgi:hypothetical protein